MASTIYDIAERAGVGIATVSRVINGSSRVSDRTRAQVQAAMNELGFRPNAAARRLAAGAPSRPRVAALAPFFTSTFYFNVCKPMTSELRQAGVDFVLVNVRDSEDADRQLERLLTERGCEGVLLCSVELSDERQAQFENLGIPIIALDCDRAKVPHARVDNVEGGRILSRTLSEGGSQNQVLVLGTRKSRVLLDREKGFLEASPPSSRVFEADALDIEAGASMVEHLLREVPNVDGIACTCDTLAVGIVRELQKLGRKVPEEIQVVGFDDQPLMDVMGLTTIKQPMQEFGTWGARAVAALIADPYKEVKSETMPLEVMHRKTTRAPKNAN
ncbi:MAG: hypothetical protein B6A08_13855 [Sorangiineae bacterium NIC37A_2]|jgi:DNA-binding LacI/PurR family transcriptional regulator|nr:MAG: hypothetical protein B6A08_13855 [Sorangiineae bacterium NIC37A_2]